MGAVILLTFLEKGFWTACIVCELALCFALIKRGLLRPYRFLFALAFVNVIRDVVLSVGFGTASAHYGLAWVSTLPALMFVQVASVLEAYTKLIKQYPGLGVFAWRLLLSCLALLILASGVSVPWEFGHHKQSIVDAVFLFYRYFALLMAGCLALSCLVLWRFPKPDQQLARNLTVHLWILVSYFSVYAVSCLSANVLGIHETVMTIIDIAMLAALCGVYISWALSLTPAGESAVHWPKLQPDLLAIIDARNVAAFQRAKSLRRN